MSGLQGQVTPLWIVLVYPAFRKSILPPAGAVGRMYVTGRNGTTLVLKRSKTLQVIASNKLDETIDSSPALAGNQLFLRGSNSLYCIADDGKH